MFPVCYGPVVLHNTEVDAFFYKSRVCSIISLDVLLVGEEGDRSGRRKDLTETRD